MPSSNRDTMRPDDDESPWLSGSGGSRKSSRRANRGGKRWHAWQVLAGLNVLVFLAWHLGGREFLMDNFVLSREAILRGQPWVVLTAPFLHIDFLHLCVNLLFLRWCGRAVEEIRGRGTVFALYMVAGVASSLIYLALPIEDRLAGPLPADSSGTGFYVTDDILLTNAHVVERNQSVTVQTDTGLKRGTVVARDEKLDLALVRVDGDRGQHLVLGVGSIQAGRTVFAYGYGVLRGESDTLLLTRGTISAVTPDYIIFDARVNPGNSGGPLVDADGRWVGVVTAKTHVGDGLDSLGYAVEGETASRWAADRGVRVEVDERPPGGDVPPPGVGDSVVRILVGAPIPGVLGDYLYWFDFPIFGASSSIWAMGVLVLFTAPRTTVLRRRYPVLLIIPFGFYILTDAFGVLRLHSGSSASLLHGYHCVGALVGILFYRMMRVHVTSIFDGWLANRRRARLVRESVDSATIEMLEPVSASASSRLDAASSHRLDEILSKISRSGLDALTPEEREFLDQVSGQLGQ